MTQVTDLGSYGTGDRDVTVEIKVRIARNTHLTNKS
jgi:hypothetical protein